MKHNEKGTTVGSIDLGYEYVPCLESFNMQGIVPFPVFLVHYADEDALMKSLECTTQGSCLETSVVDLEKEDTS